MFNSSSSKQTSKQTQQQPLSLQWLPITPTIADWFQVRNAVTECLLRKRVLWEADKSYLQHTIGLLTFLSALKHLVAPLT